MREVTITELAEALAGGGACLVDVREAAEYAEGHVPGALHIAMGRLPARVAELRDRQPVHVICASGNRSAAMTDFLTGAGIEAASVAGGTAAWIRAGHPVETGAGR